MPTIDVYTTPTCGYCKMLKAFLNENSVPFTEHDVSGSDEAREEMQNISGGSMSVPVIVFNKGRNDQEVQIGYDAEKVNLALKI